MIAVLKHGTTQQQTDHLVTWLRSMNLDVHISKGQNITILGLIGDTSRVDMDLLGSLEIVDSVKRVSEPFKQANRKFHPADTVVTVGNAKFGGQEALVVLDHVFIPNEYIFLNGEYQFAGMMVERFAGYHRQSYGGCKVGVGDVVIGAAALAAEYNGVEKASAVKDKLIEMTHLNETLYSCGIACSCEGCPTRAGNYQIDLLLANVCKQNVTRFPYEIVRLAEDIAGGLMVTMPSQKDFESDLPVGREGETIGEICKKYFATKDGVSTEDRQRILRFLENMCLGAAAVGYRTESMHGAGSPQAQRIMIARQGDIQGKKKLAKNIAGIK